MCKQEEEEEEEEEEDDDEDEDEDEDEEVEWTTSKAGQRVLASFCCCCCAETSLPLPAHSLPEGPAEAADATTRTADSARSNCTGNTRQRGGEGKTRRFEVKFSNNLEFFFLMGSGGE